MFDSGSEFEEKIAELAPERFNDDDGDEMDDEEDCDRDEFSNLMATATYVFSNRIPFYIQLSGLPANNN